VFVQTWARDTRETEVPAAIVREGRGVATTTVGTSSLRSAIFADVVGEEGGAGVAAAGDGTAAGVEAADAVFDD
jgi:hypothetical protein